MAEVSGPGLILVVFWNEIDVAAKTTARRPRKRSGKKTRIDSRIGWSYVTVMVKDGPVVAGCVKVPAQTPIVIGVGVLLFAPRVPGSPMGFWNSSPLLVEGQAPRTSELVTETLSGAVP